jgi:hypothetical protein
MEESEIRLLRSICGRKWNEVRRERGIVDNEEVNYLYSLHSTVRVIKSRKMGWVGHVARIGRVEVYTGFLLRNLRERTLWKTQA